jgi:hypothetical protein
LTRLRFPFQVGGKIIRPYVNLTADDEITSCIAAGVLAPVWNNVARTANTNLRAHGW